MLGVVVAAVVLQGEPQCPTSGIMPCARRIGDGRFGAHIAPGWDPQWTYVTGAPFTTTGAPAEAMCSAANYARLNACGANADDLRLTIVEPAAFRGASVALDSFYPAPWVDGAHIDQHHAVHGKVYDLVGPRDGGDPCVKYNWALPVDPSGKIVVARHQGSCNTMMILRNAMWAVRSPKPPPVAFISARGAEEELFSYGFPATAWGFDNVPMHMGPGALAYMLAEAEGKGERLRGKIELTCTAAEAPPAAVEFTDGCPDDRLRGLCNNMPVPEDRLCSKCPLQLKHAGETVCAYGSRLFPARAAHFFQAARALPSSVEAVYVVPPPWGGCRAADYAGVAGKVAVFAYRYCMLDSAGVLHAARLAEQQGATGVVFMSHRKSWFMLSGPGLLHNVPIHVVSAEEVHVVVRWFSDHGDGANSSLTLGLVDEDAAPDPVFPLTPAPAPPHVVVADMASFEATPGVVILIVVVVLLAGAIGGKLAAEQRRTARAEGIDGASEGWPGVPLSVASTLLSVSLLVVVTVIACSLSARAAREAADASASDGEAATELTYNEARENAAEMLRQVLSMALGQVTDSLETNMQAAEETVAGVQELMTFWDGSWEGFKERAAAFYGQSMFGRIALGQLHTGVQTLEGFYFDSKWMTDFTTEVHDGFGIPYNVEEKLSTLQAAKTETGWVAGLRLAGFDSVTFASDPSTHGLWQGPQLLWEPWNMEDSPLRRIGAELVDPVAEVRRLRLGPGQYGWRVASEGVTYNSYDQWMMPMMSVSVFMPLFDATKEKLRGVITSSIDIENFYGVLLSAKTRDAALENMTAVVYDSQTGALIGSTNHPLILHAAKVVDLFFDGYTVSPHLKGLPVSESLEVGDNALYNYLQAHPVEGTAEGELDQRDYYSHPDLHELNVAVGTGGTIVDESRHALPLLMRSGSCGECVAPDAEHGEVMRFDGENTLYVDLNLTTDVPYVAAKRKGSGSDAWGSDDPMYAYAMRIPRTRRECIYRNTSWNMKGTVQCSLRDVAAFPSALQYTISIRVKPDADVAAGDRAQHLFQHTAEGRSMVTMYASGAMTVDTREGSCVVPGVGLPGGVWTTVTARVNREKGRSMCEVLLNTKQVGRSHLSVKHIIFSGHPFAIGNGFVGAVQSVRAYKFLADAATLSDARPFVRAVPSKTWLYKVGGVDLATGLRWAVSVRIPRDDVMRRVDETNRQLMANLRQQAANTQAKLDRELAETVLAAAAVVLASVLVFLVFNDLLTRPFAEVSSVMCDAAVMRIEEIPERRSVIAELNAMQAAMRLMLENLKEYKSYIPQHLTVLSDEDTEESKSLNRSKSAALSVSDSGRQNSLCSEHSGSLRARASRVVASNTFALQLSTRKVSVAALNVVGFTKVARAMEVRDLLNLHGTLTEWLTTEAAELRGIVETFSGDRFFVTFNASKALTMSHRAAAGVLGCTFGTQCTEMGLTPSAALAGGEATVGNMGCATMRKFSFVSSLVPFVNALERHAACVGAATLTCALIHRDCQRDIVFRRAGLFGLRKFNGSPVPIFEALKKGSAGGADEWMYELQRAEKDNPHKEWDALVEAVMTGDWASASGLTEAAAGPAPLAVAMREAVYRLEYAVPDYSTH